MRLAYCAVMIILLCVCIAVEERKIKVTKEEAYWDGFRKALNEYGKLPTLPIILDDSTEEIDYKCLHCGKEYIVPKDNKPKYCSECGREIDWEDKAYGV